MRLSFSISRLSAAAVGLLCLQVASANVLAEYSKFWTFSDATAQVNQKGGEAGKKLSFSPNSPISDVITLAGRDTLKILLTTKEDDKPKRPHQVFLLVQDSDSDLETFFSFDVKDNGKARLDLTQKDIPASLLSSSSLKLSIALGSFGSTGPLNKPIGELKLTLDPSTEKSIPAKPLRYGKLPEIQHQFRAEPSSPPKIVSIVFLAGVLAQLPLLFGLWASLGANVSHLTKSLKGSPIAHPLFFGSLLALEGVFFLYYTKTNIFQTLGAVAIIAPVALISGSRALREVRARRLAGER